MDIWLVVRKNVFMPQFEAFVDAYEDEIDALRRSQAEPFLMARKVTVIPKGGA